MAQDSRQGEIVERTSPAGGLLRDRTVWYVAGGALLLAGAMALGALVNSPQAGLRTPAGSPTAAGSGLLRQVGIWPLDWLACAASAPLFVWIARRFPFPGQRWRWSLLLQLALVAGTVFAVAVFYYAVAMPNAMADADSARFFLLSHLFVGVPPFGVMILAIQALESSRRFRQREIEAARLQSQLAAFRLETLTAQLHPHFLFNTLQGISTLIHRDPDRADSMLHRLSDLLRVTLDRGGEAETTLEKELEALNHYVQIQQERFGDRLKFEIRPEIGTLQGRVPFFVLQPLVENAVEHGVVNGSGQGVIRVTAQRLDNWLELCVTDNGTGWQPERREGVGLANTRRRLRELHGERFDFELETPEEGGARVLIRLPFRVDASQGGPEA